MANMSRDDASSTSAAAHQHGTCPICDSELRPSALYQPLGFWECMGCEFLVKLPQATDAELEAHYGACYYPDQSGRSPVYRNTSVGEAEQIIACLKAAGLVPAPGSRVLDLGCGEGAFAIAARRVGLVVDGVERGGQAGAMLADAGVSVVATLEDLPSGPRYDLIAMLDVIEHVRSPLTTLESVRARIRPDGVLYLSTPNWKCLKAKLEGRRWDQATNPTHLFLFSPRALSELLRRCGFKRVPLRCVLRRDSLPPWRQAVSVAMQLAHLSAAMRIAAVPI